MKPSVETLKTLLNNEHATMVEVAVLAQKHGMILVERGGEFSFCDQRTAPTGWRSRRRCALGAFTEAPRGGRTEGASETNGQGRAADAE